MGSTAKPPPAVPVDALVKAAIGYAGLAMCLTLVFLSMRAVMDIGGSCAEGGPYVISNPCPEGTTLTLLGGIFLGIVFTLLATVGGAAVGGIWSAAPLFAWSGLFGSLGWNFLDYGVFNAPAETGVDIGGLICGVLFWAMAFGPLLVAILGMRAGSRRAPGASSGSSSGSAGSSSGRPGSSPTPATVARDGHTVTYTTTVVDGEIPDAMRAELEAMALRLGEATSSGALGRDREELTEIASDFGAAIGAAMAATPMASSGLAPVSVPPGPIPPFVEVPGPVEPEPEFTEGNQALLDRLERLADMRDRGLLDPAEYETAKAAIMTELEGRA